jgi:hypothetical protein
MFAGGLVGGAVAAIFVRRYCRIPMARSPASEPSRALTAVAEMLMRQTVAAFYDQTCPK